MSRATKDTTPLSIGDLSRATGIPIGTLRSWESRYGFPAPRRLESGHRRHDPACRRPIVLGTNTPVEDVAAAARQSAARAVLIGSSPVAPREVLVPQLAALERLLEPRVSLGVGGTELVLRGVTRLSDFTALERWSAALGPTA